jgi:hypothetical protein
VRQTLPDLNAAADSLRPVRDATAADLPEQELAALIEPLAAADRQLAASLQRLADLPSTWGLRPLDQARDELTERVQGLSGPVHSAAIAAEIGPGMLGSGGPRRYLVLFHNRAEVRPDGGLVGGFAEVVTDRGRVQVRRFGQNSDLPPLSEVPPTVDPRFLAAYGNRGAGSSWINTNLSPHYPENAAAFAAMYASGTGEPVDGVLTLDAVALQALAGLTGQELQGESEDVTVAAEDLADFLERGQYELPLRRDARKDLVAELGQQILTSFTSSPVALRPLLTTLGDLAEDGHLKLASTRPQEQGLLGQFPLAGALPASEPYLGVFLSNAAGSKLDVYLHATVRYTCQPYGRAVAEVVLRNAPPEDLPEYVTLRSDRPQPPVPVGQNRVALTVVGSEGARLQGLTVDGEARPLPAGTDVQGRPSWRVVLELPREQDRTLTYSLQNARDGAPLLQTQPLVQPVEEVVTCG